MKHVFVAIATSQYDNLEDALQLPQLVDVVRRVRTFFTETLKYSSDLHHLALNPGADSLRGTLSTWFRSEDRRNQWIVLYMTGHAVQSPTGKLYFLTHEYVDKRFVSGPFDFGDLAEMIAAQTDDGRSGPAQNVLLMLDSCFAGVALDEIAARLRNSFMATSRGRCYIIASAYNEAAVAGVFSDALITTISDLAARHARQPYLYFDQIMPELYQNMKQHKPIDASVGFATNEPHFFPNPMHVAFGSEPLLVSETHRKLLEQEYRDHWEPRSRGVQFADQAGSYFVGRTAVLDELEAFLDDARDARPRIITGGAGSGKSAILARIVTTRRRESTQEMTVAFFAKGKTAKDLLSEAAACFGTSPDMRDIVEQLGRMSAPVRIVCDALDEASEPSQVSRHFLMPLTIAPNVLLVVGTRRTYLPDFEGAAVIDIDDRLYSSASDMKEYVAARLMRRDEPGALTPYADISLVQAVAARVTERAFPNYLTARLVVEDLLADREALNPHTLARIEFPRTVDAAFAEYLHRFAVDESRVRDLLLPLAFSEGSGLPWDLSWPAIASQLSTNRDRRYNNEDVSWLLNVAGAFILGSLEDGRSVYRLFHEALAEQLISERSASHPQGPEAFGAYAHSIIVGELVGSVARNEQYELDWLSASPYVLRYLAIHASRATADVAMANPSFVLAAEPSRLMTLLLEQPRALPEDLATVFRDIAHFALPIPQRASQFEMSARIRGFEVLANSIAGLHLSRNWSVPLARWAPRLPAPLLFSGEGVTISTFGASVVSENDTLVHLGREDGTVEVWDARDLTLKFRWKLEQSLRVLATHVALTARGSWCVASFEDGSVGAFGIDNQTSQLSFLSARTFALAITEIGMHPCCIAADEHGTLRILSLPSLEVLVERSGPTSATIYSIIVVGSGSDAYVVTGGDSLYDDDSDGSSCSKLRWWSLPDLALLAEDVAEPGCISRLTRGRYCGRDMLIVSQGGFGPAQVWDIDTRTLLLETSEFTRFAFIYERSDNECFIVTNPIGRTVLDQLILDNANGRLSLSRTREGQIPDFDPNCVEGPVRIGNQMLLFTASKAALKAWDAEQLLGTVQDRPEEAPDVTCLTYNGDVLYVGRFGKIEAFDIKSNERLLECRLENSGRIRRIVISAEGSRAYISVASGPIHIVDVESFQSQRLYSDTKAYVSNFCMAEAHGRLFAFIAGRVSQVYSVTIWDLDNGAEIPTLNRLGLSLNEGDKELRGLTALTSGDKIRFAFASRYGKVMVASFDPEMQEEPVSYFGRCYQEWHVPQAGNVYINCLSSINLTGQEILVAATEEGQITVWDFVSGELLANRVAAHRGQINDIAVRNVEGHLIIASCGADNFTRLWRLEGHQLCGCFDINVSEVLTALTFVDDEMLVVGGARGFLALKLKWDAVGESGVASFRP